MWLCGVFFDAHAFSSSRRRGLLSSCGVLASHCGGFSLQSTGSRHTGFSSFGLRALEHAGFMSSDSRAPDSGPVVVIPRLGCSTACGVFPDQKLNPYPQLWQASSYALHHQGSPSGWISLLSLRITQEMVEVRSQRDISIL